MHKVRLKQGQAAACQITVMDYPGSLLGGDSHWLHILLGSEQNAVKEVFKQKEQQYQEEKTLHEWNTPVE
jgi:translation elongation factor EF-1alpha